jgi:hypothetical protein
VLKEDMLGNPTLNQVPFQRGEEIVAMAATGQGLEMAGREAQTLHYFDQLALGVRRGQHQEIGPFEALAGCLPGQDVGSGPRGRQAPGLIRGQAHQGGVETAETQPLDQATQGLIYQEFHGVINQELSKKLLPSHPDPLTVEAMPSNFTITPVCQPEKAKGGMRFAFPPYGPDWCHSLSRLCENLRTG